MILIVYGVMGTGGIVKKITATIVITIISVALTLAILHMREPGFTKIHEEVIQSVVNIYCDDGENKTLAGSGTIISEDGLILTNAHVIHHLGHEYVSTEDHLCIISIPNSETGQPDQIYVGHSIFSDTVSDVYDMAFVKIHGPYYENGTPKGIYPRTFEAYTNHKRCGMPELGEPIRIYGYPSLIGGYALTVTDGLVSALLPEEKYVITSATVNHGNSGGLAVDSKGCIIGIPSQVKNDEIATYGVIYSDELINEFITKFNGE